MHKDLTQEEVKSLFDYDPSIGIITWKSNGIIAGHFTSLGYIRISINRKMYYAHRLAWLYFYGEFPKAGIDHINSITGDNRIINLREVTQAENNQNIKKSYKNNKSSGLLGVCIEKNGKKYRATIRINYKSHHLGYFKTADEAHYAYLEAKNQLHPFFSPL